MYMAHIEDKKAQVVSQMNVLKEQISALEQEQKNYEEVKREKRNNPELCLNHMNEWLILTEPLRDYYATVEACNNKKIQAITSTHPHMENTHDKLAAFANIPRWRAKYPEILEIERDIVFKHQRLPPYIYDNHTIGFASPVRRASKQGNQPDAFTTIPSKFMVDFIDDVHSMFHLLNARADGIEKTCKSIKKELSSIATKLSDVQKL
jgi:hypothetical protein